MPKNDNQTSKKTRRSQKHYNLADFKITNIDVRSDENQFIVDVFCVPVPKYINVKLTINEDGSIIYGE